MERTRRGLYKYHGTSRQKDRLRDKICRCQSTGVKYSLISAIRSERIYDPRNPTILLTTDPIGIKGRFPNRFIFAVNEEYDVRFAPDGHRPAPDAVKHESLFENADVWAAGEILVRDGIVVSINDNSGSYDCYSEMEKDKRFSLAVLKAIELHSIPVSEALRNRLNTLGDVNAE